MDLLDALVVATGARPITCAGVIDSVGTQSFPDALSRDLRVEAGVDYFAAVRIKEADLQLAFAGGIGTSQRSPGSIASTQGLFECYKRSLQLANAALQRERTVVLRVDVDDQRDGLAELISPQPSIRERLLIVGIRAGRLFGLVLFRNAPGAPFDPASVERAGTFADLWLSLAAKQEQLAESDKIRSKGGLFGDIASIEGRLESQAPMLTRREKQVCARILRGLSTPGIAIDLGLCEDSVATYRKRAYRRLGIGTRLELIQGYLSAFQELAQQ